VEEEEEDYEEGAIIILHEFERIDKPK